MRLVPPEDVPRTLTIMFTGQCAFAAFVAPIGSYLGDVIGWRGVFWLLVPGAALWDCAPRTKAPATRHCTPTP